MRTRQPKILCIIETLGMGGGAEQLLASLLPEMRLQGADVEVAALFDWPNDLGAELERDGVVVHRLNLRGSFSVGAAAAKLRRLVRGARYDLFWGHLYYGNLHAWLARRLAGQGALVSTLHTRCRGRRKTLKNIVARGLERRFLSESDAIVAVSAALRKEYIASYDITNIGIVHNGVDCQRIATSAVGDRSSIRRSFGYSDDDFLIVTPARYIQSKGHAYLIEALTILASKGIKPKLLMCGHGPLEQSLAALVNKAGLSGSATISENIPHDRLMPLIAAADVATFPSLYETFGIAAAEAMSIGTPCILTDIDGFRELIGDADCAVIVPARDPRALAEAIGAVRLDRENAAVLGQRGRAHVLARFDVSDSAKRWLEVMGRTSRATWRRGEKMPTAEAHR